VCFNKIYNSIVSIDKQSETWSTLLPLPFNFASEYIITNIQENQEGLDMNGIFQLLVYDEDANLLMKNINTIKNREALLDTIKEVGQEVNAEKTKYMFMSQHRNT
jgi:hypothetical protein